MNFVDLVLERDGDDYFRRNFEGIGTIADPVMSKIDMINSIRPITRVLEIGCTTGFRLDKIRQAFGCSCSGLEAGRVPVAEGKRAFPHLDLRQGIAPSALTTWPSDEFDCVILGFFGYLVQREFLFELSAQVDRLLVNGGHVITFDFIHPYPLRSEYAHDASLSIFKMDPSSPWTWSPTYTLVDRTIYPLAQDPKSNSYPQSWSTVDVIRKLSPEDSYPEVLPVKSAHSTDSHD